MHEIAYNIISELKLIATRHITWPALPVHMFENDQRWVYTLLDQLEQLDLLKVACFDDDTTGVIKPADIDPKLNYCLCRLCDAGLIDFV